MARAPRTVRLSCKRDPAEDLWVCRASVGRTVATIRLSRDALDQVIAAVRHEPVDPPGDTGRQLGGAAAGVGATAALTGLGIPEAAPPVVPVAAAAGGEGGALLEKEIHGRCR